MPIVHESLAAMLAELAEVTNRVIEKHQEADAYGRDVLKHYGPFGVQVHGVDGHLATFYEEGIEFFPESTGPEEPR